MFGLLWFGGGWEGDNQKWWKSFARYIYCLRLPESPRVFWTWEAYCSKSGTHKTLLGEAHWLKPSTLVSTSVSSDNSFQSVRQEPSIGPWKGSPFLQQMVTLVGTLLRWDWHPDHSGYSGASLPANGPDPAAATGTLLSLASSWHGQLARGPRPVRNKGLYWPLSPSLSLSSP